MSEVDQPSNTPSGDSSQESIAGPPPVIDELARYMRLLSPAVPTYSGELNTMTFEEWELLMFAWFDAHVVPEQYRVGIATMQLRGPALWFWHFRRHAIPDELSWFAFSLELMHRFWSISQVTRWNHLMSQFMQWPGEDIRSYGVRFDQDPVSRHPVVEMRELSRMLAYARGVQPYFRIPHPQVPFSTFAEMRAAYEQYDDRDFLPFTQAPDVPMAAPAAPPAPAVPPVPAAPAAPPAPPVPAAPAQEVPDLNVAPAAEPVPLPADESEPEDDDEATDSDMEWI